MNTRKLNDTKSELPDLSGLDSLRRLAARIVGVGVDPDDVVSESLLFGLRERSGSVRHWGAWLKGVVRKKALEARRAQVRRGAHEAEVAGAESPMNPVDIASSLETHEKLLAAVKGLEEPYRTAVWRRYVEGKEAAEIARESGVPVETIRTRTKRGLERLRHDLDQRHGGRREAWVSSVAAFAGVESGLAATVATSASAGVTASAAKVWVGAAALMLAVGSVVVGERLLSLPGSSIKTPSIGAGNQGATAASLLTSEPVEGRHAASGSPVPTREGRVEVQSRAFDARRPEGLANDSLDFEGEFSFCCNQGYSFTTKEVTADLENSDLVFSSSAGGLSTVALATPGGRITNLEVFTEPLPELKFAAALARAVVRAEPESVGLRSNATGRSTPHSDAFLLQVREGGWVAMAIVRRGENRRGSARDSITIRYSYRAERPEFTDGRGDLISHGIEVDSQALARLGTEMAAAADREYRERTGPFFRRLAELDQRAAALTPEIRAKDGPDVMVSAVLNRDYASAMGSPEGYIVSTYSFEHATRDDVKKTRNDWDFCLSSGGELATIDVRMVVDDVSVIRDLGTVDWASIRAGRVDPGVGAESAVPKVGHTFLIHTSDSDSELWILMRPEEIVHGESMIFSWVKIADPKVVRAALERDQVGMESPVARLQIHGGAGGGNGYRISLRGRTNVDGDSEASQSRDLRAIPDINDRHTARASGGFVPQGRVYLVERIAYQAYVKGDSNGHGEFTLWVNGRPLAHVFEDPKVKGQQTQFHWFGLDRGVESVAVEGMPIQAQVHVRIPIRRGDEDKVYVEIANSSWADVTLSGRFVPEEGHPQDELPRDSDFSFLRELEGVAAALDDSAAIKLFPAKRLDFAAKLERVLEIVPPGAWRERLMLVLAECR